MKRGPWNPVRVRVPQPATEWATLRLCRRALGMPRVATKLIQTATGHWTARKRIPADVRDAFDGRWEVFFRCDPMPVTLARIRHRAWLSEIDARIANARAARAGREQMLTLTQAR